jgi:hypothetical protein
MSLSLPTAGTADGILLSKNNESRSSSTESAIVVSPNNFSVAFILTEINQGNLPRHLYMDPAFFVLLPLFSFLPFHEILVSFFGLSYCSLMLTVYLHSESEHQIHTGKVFFA